MHDPFKNPDSFRKILRETLEVTVVDKSNNTQLAKKELDDDDGDELLWFVDKYGRVPVAFKDESQVLSVGDVVVLDKAGLQRVDKNLNKAPAELVDGTAPTSSMMIDDSEVWRVEAVEKKGQKIFLRVKNDNTPGTWLVRGTFFKKAVTKKEMVPAAAMQVKDIISKLTTDPGERDKMFEVVFPWGQVGVDGLRRIMVASRRAALDGKGRAFPFFDSAAMVAPGATIAFPTAPNPSVVDFLYNLRTRIKSNDTGKGEFLFCLLTAGIAGGEVGDVNVDGKNWELKDSGEGGARLGDLSSIAFKKKLRDALGSGDAKYAPFWEHEDLEAMLVQSTSVKSLKPEARALLDELVRDSVKAEGALAGFVVIKGKSFVCHSIEEVVFQNVSSSGRVHVKFGT